MLACQYNSVKILEYLYEQVVLKSNNIEQTKRRLLANDELLAKCGISAIHLACMLGNLDILRILHFKF